MLLVSKLSSSFLDSLIIPITKFTDAMSQRNVFVKQCSTNQLEHSLISFSLCFQYNCACLWLQSSSPNRPKFQFNPESRLSELVLFQLFLRKCSVVRKRLGKLSDSERVLNFVTWIRARAKIWTCYFHCGWQHGHCWLDFKLFSDVWHKTLLSADWHYINCMNLRIQTMPVNVIKFGSDIMSDASCLNLVIYCHGWR